MNTPYQPNLPGGLESAPTKEQIKEYMDLTHPFTMLSSDGTDARVGDAIRALPENDRTLYRELRDTFMEGGRFGALITEGDYGKLGRYARDVAGVVTEGIYGQELTLPHAFGIHALVSATATVFRPFEEVRHRDDRTSFFLTHVARNLALAVPEQVLFDGPNPVLLGRAVGKRSLLLARAVGESHEWMRAKHEMLGESLLYRARVIMAIDNEPDAVTEDLAELRLSNNTLFDELQRLRRYSIKPAVHEGEVTSWSIDDTSSIGLQAAAMAAEEGSGVRPDQWPTMLLTAIEHSTDIQGMVSTKLISAVEDYEHDWSMRPVFMNHQGELFADPQGAMPLLDFYKAAGKPVNYESLRQLLIQKYFDLTVPVEVVKAADEHSRRMLGSRDPDADRERGTVYYDLLLPRIRLVRDHTAESLDELEAQELRNDGREPEAYPYPRTHHTRKLPKGYKASEAALQRAREDGVEVPEGETYVKAYRPDDSIAKPIGHRVRRRKPRKQPGQGQPTDPPEQS